MCRKQSPWEVHVARSPCTSPKPTSLSTNILTHSICSIVPCVCSEEDEEYDKRRDREECRRGCEGEGEQRYGLCEGWLGENQGHFGRKGMYVSYSAHHIINLEGTWIFISLVHMMFMVAWLSITRYNYFGKRPAVRSMFIYYFCMVWYAVQDL